MSKCNMCQSDNVSVFSEIETVKYKTGFIDCNVEYSICNDCKREFISNSQILKNEKEVNNKKLKFKD